MSRRKPPAAALHSAPDDIEQQFYEALQRADLTRALAVWADDSAAVCLRPLLPPAMGLAAIHQQLEQLFRMGPLPVEPLQVRKLRHGAQGAVHQVLERITYRESAEAEPQWQYRLATNVYLHMPQGWRLVAHHASVIDGAEWPADAAAALMSGLLH